MEQTHYHAVVKKHFGKWCKPIRKLLAVKSAEQIVLEYIVSLQAANSSKTIQNFNMQYASMMLEFFRRRFRQETGKERFCYSTITEDPEFNRILHIVGDWLVGLGMTESGVQGMLNLSAMIYYHAVMFELAGERVYEVTPGLAEQLAHTELRGVVSDDLRMPYESIYLIVPAQANLRVYNEQSGWHKCVGIYLVEDTNLTGIEPGLVSGEQTRGWRVLAVGEDKTKDQSAFMQNDDALVYFRTALPENRPVDEILDILDSVYQDEDNNRKVLAGWGEMRIEWRRLFKWLMNAMLYVTHVEPGEHWICNDEARKLWNRMQKLPKKSAKRDKLKKRYNQLDPYFRFILGTKVRVQRGQSNSGNGPSVKRQTIAVKTRVPGHWRRVVHGKGRAFRRWQWIEPYWKNKEGIALRGRDHEVR